MADMQELIARLEAGPVYLTHKEAYDLAIFFGSDTALGMASVIRKAFAGGSIDAALALAERVLPGWAFQIDIQSDLSWVLAAPDWWAPALSQGPESRGGQSSVAKTPALALCIAILKAKARGEGG